jgi:hypothetical protein
MKSSVGSFPHPSFADQSAGDTSVNVPNASQVTYLFWLIVRCYRYFVPSARIFRVRRFPHRSFADQSANDATANVPNVAQVTSLF